MTVKRHILRKLGVLVAGAIFVALVVVSPALAASPWWHVSLGAAPASLQPGSATDEVQELTAEPGTAFQLNVGGKEVGLFESAPYPYSGAFTPATAANVQTALDAVYGGGTVTVSGGPGGSGALKVSSVGKGADQTVGAIEVGLAIGGKVEAKVLTLGRADGQIVVTASNLGTANATGVSAPMSIVDKLPVGLEAVAIEGFSEEAKEIGNHLPLECELTSLSCNFTGVLPPYEQLQVRISVVVKKGATSGEVNEATVSGGGASSSASAEHKVAIGGTPDQFGVEDYEMSPEQEGGAPDKQAGSHPFQLTTTLILNQSFEATQPPALAKDLNFKLPAGLIGNPTVFPQCTDTQFLKTESFINECPSKTAVGVAAVTVFIPSLTKEVATAEVPLFNLKPNVGEPARFGFDALNVPVVLDTSVRTGEDYGVTVSVDNITETATFFGSRFAFRGVPGDPRHDSTRGWGCIRDELLAHQSGVAPCAPLGEEHPPPLLSLPTSCTGPLQTSVEADSWQQQGAFDSVGASEALPALAGCNRLQFTPSISVAPDSQAGSTPTGLNVDVHVPQQVSLDTEGLSEADVKDTTVALPSGVALNPAAADGLQACTDVAEAGRPEGEIELHNALQPSCPEASKVGTVEIATPLLANPLTGYAYLAAQNANPFGSLVALYVVVEDPVSGTLVKLAGEVKPDPVTGQLISTFENTPQLPFEDFKLHFFGGNRAPLTTPALCGAYTTNASIVPWSFEEGGHPAESSSTFDVTSGPNGSPCKSPLPFAPSLTAGTTSIQAGGFSPFTMTMSREDGQQSLQAISLKMPPGLSGLLASVKLCGEPQADQGTCGPESEIGETTVSVGVGGDPFSVKGGKVFITGGYDGAPYGLSIVNPAKAGPYDLEAGTPCDCVVVRAKIEVDPTTAALTISSDNSGPHKIPSILDGIPLQIQHVNVTINRPGFTFNPTNCNPMSITGSLSSTEGASAALSVPLQVTNCAVLGFKPAFSVSTAGKTSRAKGASLHVKLVYPKAPFGSQANIAKVKVDLPKQLPSQLKTLQKACPAATFDANPADCDPESKVGEAKATTPLLPVPLTGPVYFVSYGDAKFPELVIVLSGYGTTVQLHAETYIDEKTGVTSSTFRTIPDVPVGVFELTLPQGKFPALAANGNLCKDKLKMPTAFTAQNGATIKQSTPISVTGCPKAVKKKKAIKHKRKK
jgi:hypothetical protein